MDEWVDWDEDLPILSGQASVVNTDPSAKPPKPKRIGFLTSASKPRKPKKGGKTTRYAGRNRR